MFGNTHEVANCIADGLRPSYDASVVRVGDVTDEMVDAADLVVVGGPTHAHGLSGRRTRVAAKQMAEKDDNDFQMEPDTLEYGLRDWFRTLHTHNGKLAAAFDTRGNGPAFLTGRASRRIGHRLRSHGFHVMADKSFIVSKYGHLAQGELGRARAWGEMLSVVARVAERDAAAA